MPQEHIFNDFSAGWIPTDDAQNGRKNGLLQMDNVELDKNGSLSLAGGTQVIQTYTGAPIELYATTDSDGELVYAATADGKIYRDATVLGTGGDATRAAFGTAFGDTLCCSGSKRLKDSPPSTTWNLGVGGNATPPTLSWDGPNRTAAIHVSSFTGFTFTSGGGNAISFSNLGSAINWSTLSFSGLPVLQADPSDIINIQIPISSGSPSAITSIQLIIVTSAPVSGVIQDNFTATTSGLAIGSTTGTVTFTRGDFVSNNGNWATVWGFIISVNANDAVVCSGITLTQLPGLTYASPSQDLVFYNGVGNSPGGSTVQYILIGVNTSNSSYIAKSASNQSVASAPFFVPPGMGMAVIYTAFTDPQVDTIWLYRIGGNLAQWYRIATFPNTSSIFYDNVSDLIAEDIDLFLDLNLISVANVAGGITERVNTIIGPMSGRWYYFTDQFVYPSDINDPDLANTTLAIRTCGSTNEIFMWAVKVAEGYIVIGTSIDIYVLSGTFTTLPDGTVDIYYRPLVCQHPPIAIDAAFNAGLVYYIASDGWRSIGTDASTSRLIVAPNTDQLYIGFVPRYGYANAFPFNGGPLPGVSRFPVVVTNNKLWCCIPRGPRIEVWDFIRNYWRSVNYSTASNALVPTAITRSAIGLPILGTDDLKSRYIDLKSSGLVDGATKQVVNILTPVIQVSPSLNRNDLYTLKVRCLTSTSDSLNCYLNNNGNNTLIGSAISTNTTGLEQEFAFDIPSNGISTLSNWQYYLNGTFSLLLISDIRIEYDARPNPVTSTRIYNTNFGTAAKKRLRMWPIVIDTLGFIVVVEIYSDNALIATQLVTTTDKTTVPIYVNVDAFGTDYGAFIQTGAGMPFEFWGLGQPEIVQTCPPPKQYDQVGPQDLFRYGKLQEFELRILPLGGNVGTTSPLVITFYFDDYSVYSTTLTLNNGQEQTYSFGVPKGTAGTITRIELGPTTYPFVRYYIRVRATVTGSNTTDNSKWITL